MTTYTIKGKRRFRAVGRREPNKPSYYKHRSGRVFDRDDADEFTWRGMVFHIDMNS
jgi:hypothetical protein